METKPGLVDASTARVAEALNRVANRKFEQPLAVLHKMTLWDVAELLREVASELEASGTDQGEPK